MTDADVCQSKSCGLLQDAPKPFCLSLSKSKAGDETRYYYELELSWLLLRSFGLAETLADEDQCQPEGRLMSKSIVGQPCLTHWGGLPIQIKLVLCHCPVHSIRCVLYDSTCWAGTIAVPFCLHFKALTSNFGLV